MNPFLCAAGVNVWLAGAYLAHKHLSKDSFPSLKTTRNREMLQKKRIIFHEKETRADEDKTYKDINMIIPWVSFALSCFVQTRFIIYKLKT